MKQEDADPGNLVLRAADAFNAAGGRACRVCGCTDDRACVYTWEDGEAHTCYWVTEDLCSECEDAGDVDAPPLLYDAHGGVLVK